MKDKLTVFTKYLLDVMFYAGIAVTLTLPVSIRFYGRYNPYFEKNWIPLVFLFGISGVLTGHSLLPIPPAIITTCVSIPLTR